MRLSCSNPYLKTPAEIFLFARNRLVFDPNWQSPEFAAAALLPASGDGQPDISGGTDQRHAKIGASDRRRQSGIRAMPCRTMDVSGEPGSILMWAAARIFVVCILAVLSMPVRSSADVADIKVGLAKACTDDTPAPDRTRVPVVPSMVAFSVDPGSTSKPDFIYSCIVQGTRVDLSVTSVETAEDRWKVGSVKISIAPKDQVAFNKALTDSAGGKLVLLHGDKAIIEFEILRAVPQRSLFLKGFDLPEAQAIKQVIVDAL
jgi:hypothetical protein